MSRRRTSLVTCAKILFHERTKLWFRLSNAYLLRSTAVWFSDSNAYLLGSTAVWFSNSNAYLFESTIYSLIKRQQCVPSSALEVTPSRTNSIDGNRDFIREVGETDI
ncbi:hypothetical protein PMIN04_003652 [Paraphaeosphaeria minitans]